MSHDHSPCENIAGPSGIEPAIIWSPSAPAKIQVSPRIRPIQTVFTVRLKNSRNLRQTKSLRQGLIIKRICEQTRIFAWCIRLVYMSWDTASHLWAPLYFLKRILGKTFGRRHFETFFLLFPENRFWHSMQIVSNGDNLHEMSNLVFWQKYEKMPPICCLLN